MLAAIVLLLAVFGASTQCVADCLTQQSVPPCHQHSQEQELRLRSPAGTLNP